LPAWDLSTAFNGISDLSQRMLIPANLPVASAKLPPKLIPSGLNDESLITHHASLSTGSSMVVNS
jgi:hypothetical protein